MSSFSVVRRGIAAALACAVAASCSNDPYPESDRAHKVYYTTYQEAPRTLDPAISYTVTEHEITQNIYEGLVEYHFLKRPHELIPALAEAVPAPDTAADGRTTYRFRVRSDVWFQEDPCFAAFVPGQTSRRISAEDIAFQLHRLGDPELVVPIAPFLERIRGFVAFGEKLKALRADASFAALRADEQYARAGGIEGIRAQGLDLEIELSAPYPQLLYWLAMPFGAAVPWEAVAHYDGRERAHFRDHPVGTGAYRMARYEKQARIVLERNERWYGRLHPEWRAPGATYPSEGEPGDAAAGRLDPRYVGTPLAYLERIEFRREKEDIPGLGKFMQGYYDVPGDMRQTFETVMRIDRLSPEMQARGIRFENDVELATYYVGFNMDDPVVGRSAGERGRKLRQAMSLVIDSAEYLRLFQNGRGVAAQTPLPPGLFGYREDYANPFRKVDREAARRLLAEAGYPDGIDPATKQPLRLGFDAGDPTSAARQQWQFLIDSWRTLGLDVEMRATTYNEFQEKIRRGAYQVFRWGWVADYPDPENFLFLLESSMSRTRNDGPNTANFSDPAYDALFTRMKDRPNDDERRRLIEEMLAILERERPWIELYHREKVVPAHRWVANLKPFGISYPTLKYRDVDAAARGELRAEWNAPVRWPMLALAAVALALLVPALRTFYRERL
jgi:oligopeptide transport system substrate-binding protein